MECSKMPGIAAMQVYVPRLYVEQADLERHDAQSDDHYATRMKGKYTKGLGQNRMAIATDAEDCISMALTVTDMLLRNHGVDISRIGRVDVGSESNPDKSKSIKSHLMRLFSADTDGDRLGSRGVSIEGCDCVNACYGGMQAVFNALDWLHSPCS
ncbi:hypothetical protein KIPB_011916, partial [Kipferlia bialata]|eukprot:g11916.t1